MDDPNHAIARREDLDQFRKVKLGKHKSYAYGEGASKASSTTVNTVISTSQSQVSQSQSKRNTAPLTNSSQMYAAANIARGRRTRLLATLQEDAGNMIAEAGNMIAEAEDTDTDIGDSPCPPTKNGMLKGKRNARVSVSRVETYGSDRMTLGC